MNKRENRRDCILCFSFFLFLLSLLIISGVFAETYFIFDTDKDSNTFNITIDMLIEKLSALDVNKFIQIDKPGFLTWEESKVYITSHVLGKVGYYIFTDSLTGEAQAVAVYASNDNFDQIGKRLYSLMQVLGLDNSYSEDDVAEFVSLLGDQNSHQLGTMSMQFFVGEERSYFVIHPTASSLDISSLPVFQIKSSPSFFSDDKRRWEYEQALEAYSFSTIYEMAQEYSNQFPDDAYALEIIEALDNYDAIAIQGKCIISVDSASGETSVFYRGLDKITKDNALVPCILDGSPRCLLGIQTESWVFFEDVEFYYERENVTTVSFNYFDVIREPTRGGIIEYCDTYLGELEIMAMLNNVTARFAGESKHFDHVITAVEKDALQTMCTMREIYVNLSDLCFGWQAIN